MRCMKTRRLYALAKALMGNGVAIEGEPKEGKINIIAERDGLFKGG